MSDEKDTETVPMLEPPEPPPVEEEPAIEPDPIMPMVQIEEHEDCPFLDCANEGTFHLHFTHEPQKPNE